MSAPKVEVGQVWRVTNYVNGPEFKVVFVGQGFSTELTTGEEFQKTGRVVVEGIKHPAAPDHVEPIRLVIEGNKFNGKPGGYELVRAPSRSAAPSESKGEA